MRRTWLVSLGAMLITLPAWGAEHYGKLLGQLLPPDYRSCLFFTLDGVTLADGNVPNGGAWFAVPNDAIGYKEIYALLLTAKVTGMQLNVKTDGAACGFAKVYQVHTHS